LGRDTLYRQGADGVPKDIVKAGKLMKRAKEVAEEGEQKKVDATKESAAATRPIVLGCIIVITVFGITVFLHVKRRS
jgi:hypothetical protein